MHCPKCGKTMVPTKGDYSFCPTCKEDCGGPPEYSILSSELRSYYGMKNHFTPTNSHARWKIKSRNGGYTRVRVCEILACSYFILNEARKELGIDTSKTRPYVYTEEDLINLKRVIDERKEKNQKKTSRGPWYEERRIALDEV